MDKNDNCTTCNKSACPFITIVTRCYKRPNALRNNIVSVKTQTDADYEQVFIIDKKGKGLAAADMSLNLFKEMNCGDYIMVLDDDDMIVDKQFIQKLKHIKKEKNPDVIIWKGMFNSETHILPPTDKFWGIRPMKCAIGSFNYCVSYKLYTKYIHTCRTGITGDYDFINNVLYGTDHPKVEWVNEIFVACQNGASKGKLEGMVLMSPEKQQRVLRHKK